MKKNFTNWSSSLTTRTGRVDLYALLLVFAEGVKSGYLNYAVYKGDLFKTYEGKLIQEGFDQDQNRGWHAEQ